MSMQHFKSNYLLPGCPLLLRAQGHKNISQLVSLSELERVLSNGNNGMHVEFIGPNNVKLNPDTFYYNAAWSGPSGSLIKESVNSAWRDGCTMIVHTASQMNTRLRKLTSSIMDVGACPDAHIYATAMRNGHGFGAHYDQPDNFIVQVEGRTRWLIHSVRINVDSAIPAQEDMQRWSQSVDDFIGSQRQAIEGVARTLTAGHFPPWLDTVLEPGDVLYIPRFHFHAAITESARLSISIPMVFPCHNNQDPNPAVLKLEPAESATGLSVG
jgi:hypothetical protein